MVESILLEHIMKKYFSIGEVSKIKGVSVKSLRYYGDLGILTPAYINEKTGYRYYSLEQFVVIDLITSCIELEIPLKNFYTYITDDNYLDIELLVKDGKEIADRKMRHFEKTIESLNNISEHLKKTKEVKQIQGTFQQNLAERFFLTSEWSGDIYNVEEFMRKLTVLYKQCNEMDVSYEFNQGFLIFYQDALRVTKIFIEIPNYIDKISNLITIPKGNFLCEVFDNDNLAVGVEKYTDKMYPAGSILIVKELYDTKVEYQPTPVEFQLLAKT